MTRRTITYSTNWMGPVSLNFYEERNLIDYDEIKRSSVTGNWYKEAHIKQYYSGGRIDVYGSNYFFNEEIGLPIMKSEDWMKFSEWLETFESERVLTLEELLAEYGEEIEFLERS